MDDDRRQSIRLSTSLPCEWQSFPALPSRGELCERFHIAPAADEAHDDSESLRQALEQVGDRHVRYALELMDKRITRIERSAHANGTEPASVEVVISADGVELVVPTRVAPGAACGVHAILDDSFHFLSAAEVTRCDEVETGYVVGVRFVATDPTMYRKWNRYLLQQSPRQAETSRG